MPVFDNLNMTTAPGVEVSVVEYHTKNLLKNMRPELVHYKDLQRKTLPKHNGKNVQFRRAVPFGVISEPLKEGVTPEGQELKMTDLWATIKPYGRHIELTDEMDWALIDDVHVIANEELSAQAAQTIDSVVRDALNAGINVQYAGGRTSRTAITSADILTYDEIKNAVLSLKKALAKPFPDGFYHAIVDPDTIHDLTANPMWVDVATYQDKGKVEKYELGTIYKVKFFETTRSKVFEAQTYLYGTKASLTGSAWNATNLELTLSDTDFDAHAARWIVGSLVLVDDQLACIERATPYKDASNPAVLKLRWNPGTVSATASVTPTGGGASGIPVHSTLVYGQNHAGAVELEGRGNNVQIIIKPLGSSGASDPLNQRQTIGWKVKGFCAVILQDSFVVRIEHATSSDA